MRLLRVLALTATITLLAAACGDDDSVETGSSDDGTTERDDGAAVDLPPGSPALVGEITAVSPFEPVTEDCVPAEDLDPDSAVSSDDPPICTPEDNDVVGTVLVEEVPGVQEGRKISYTVTTDTVITGSDADGNVDGFDDLAEGQQVESWVAGDVCAESYPEQCGAEAIRVTG